MKFLEKVIEKYNKLEVAAPQWVKEYVTSPTSPINITNQTTATPTTSLDTSIKDTLQIKKDEDLTKKKEELDTIYNQVVDALKKKAVDATNKLKQTSSSIAATPSITTPSTPTV